MNLQTEPAHSSGTEKSGMQCFTRIIQYLVPEWSPQSMRHWHSSRAVPASEKQPPSQDKHLFMNRVPQTIPLRNVQVVGSIHDSWSLMISFVSEFDVRWGPPETDCVLCLFFGGNTCLFLQAWRLQLVVLVTYCSNLWRNRNNVLCFQHGNSNMVVVRTVKFETQPKSTMLLKHVMFYLMFLFEHIAAYHA